MTLKAFARLGGRSRSPAKTLANRIKMRAYWKSVRAGVLPAPRRSKAPPPLAEIARLAKPICLRFHLRRLDVFGSVARGKARRGSDVDLIATFGETPGLELLRLRQTFEKALGVPVDLLDSLSVEEMSNPYRRASINANRLTLYEKN
jgi:predicted nucleotidyltransferase